jgi:molybdopterin-containing oxidoreductase family iron-sulfur binding subunit
MDIFEFIKREFFKRKKTEKYEMLQTPKSDDKKMNRREMFKQVGKLAITAGAMTSLTSCGEKSSEAADNWDDFFQKHYRLMTPKEKRETVERLERMTKRKRGVDVTIKDTSAIENVLFGYALNISTCKGYRDCVKACMLENNLDEDAGIQYIKVSELDKGKLDIEHANTTFDHEVPADGKFYVPMQCMHCENPPCTDVCPVGATWKEEDGVVVVDYNWCVGCRYCEAACPYFARRFNWQEPNVPNEKLNTDQHYLGNRDRMKGVMEKCHFCTQRTREGRMPACQEACPTGSRIFGNLLDPKSEIRWILEHKKVFRLKEELNTQPKFYYYMD